MRHRERTSLLSSDQAQVEAGYASCILLAANGSLSSITMIALALTYSMLNDLSPPDVLSVIFYLTARRMV